MKTMTSTMVAAILALSCGTAEAQPPGGPATKLFVNNGTTKPVVFQVLVPINGRINLVKSHVIHPGNAWDPELFNIPDDRVLIAGSTGLGPWKAFDSVSFNARDSGWPSIGFELIEQGGEIKLKRLLQAAAAKPNPAMMQVPVAALPPHPLDGAFKDASDMKSALKGFEGNPLFKKAVEEALAAKKVVEDRQKQNPRIVGPGPNQAARVKFLEVIGGTGEK